MGYIAPRPGFESKIFCFQYTAQVSGFLFEFSQNLELYFSHFVFSRNQRNPRSEARKNERVGRHQQGGSKERTRGGQ